MKKNSATALLALCLVGILGGIAPVFMKIAFKEFTPVEIICFRFLLTAVILILYLFFTRKLTFTRSDMPRIIMGSLLFTGNIFLFAVGLQFTTSVASQIMYLLMPALVLVLSFLFLKQHLRLQSIASIVLGFSGGLFLILGGKTAHLSSSLGRPLGNIIILGAVFCWGSYLVFSKKLSVKYPPVTILAFNSLIAGSIALGVLVVQKQNLLFSLLHASSPALLSLMFLLLFNSFIFFFLYQWCIKHVSPFMVSLSSYLSPLAAGFVAIPLFGETITLQLLMSAVLIGISAYITFRNKNK